MSTLLTYLGILPFLFFGLMVPYLSLHLMIDAQSALYHYGLSIIAFLAGSHWDQQKEIPAMALLSNAITLLAWASLLLPPIGINMSYCALFAGLLLIDKSLLKSKKITQHYFQTRCFASLIVIGIFIFNGLWLLS